MNLSELRYPIGPFEPVASISAEARRQLLTQMGDDPERLRAAVNGLTEGQLDTPYRPEGWTVRQVVHHLADSQMNWYVRTRLALTEDQPTVKPYDEAAWADLADARTGPVGPSLALFDGLYRRWIGLFESLREEQWSRRLVHPERGVFVLDTTLPMHAWHGRHHTAQIMRLRERMGWV